MSEQNGSPKSSLLQRLRSTTIEQEKQKKRAAELAERNELADKSLSNRYDALNQKLAEAELHLRALKPLRSVWEAYAHDSSDPDFELCELLGMTKVNDKWRLCHAYADNMNPGPFENIQPIIECPVEVRVRAASIVRKLHEKIISEKEKCIPEVDAAIKELTAFCCEA